MAPVSPPAGEPRPGQPSSALTRAMAALAQAQEILTAADRPWWVAPTNS